MSSMPILQTERLVLRPLSDADAAVVQRLAGDARVAATTLTIPHPYLDGMAEVWIATHEAVWEAGRALILGITQRADGELVGVMGCDLYPEEKRAELGYWIGVPWWSKGYATEAGRVFVDYLFAELRCEQVGARCFVHNAASARVMAKIGMRFEETRLRAVVKGGVWIDTHHYAVTRADWERARSNTR